MARLHAVKGEVKEGDDLDRNGQWEANVSIIHGRSPASKRGLPKKVRGRLAVGTLSVDGGFN